MTQKVRGNVDTALLGRTPAPIFQLKVQEFSNKTDQYCNDFGRIIEPIFIKMHFYNSKNMINSAKSQYILDKFYQFYRMLHYIFIYFYSKK